ncbi:DUF4376 domain-containing protein [Chitiniphilus purpureus]|uniref:DUF4376 domain-containing protein n=1 Tax=Chitiniphilus purpureus TaxID=2981137 RepID=A0ABY6DY01_9NEIS|nr:DUF4376 domain-containing protein [Chitiniphilus sp. CD1]UXY16723.1 DUF4376 domain-containing protein [Chitiniphilus sp. CD1]
MEKTVYQADQNGWYCGPTVADESPLEPGVYLVPAGAFEEAPPQGMPGQRARRIDGQWVLLADPFLQADEGTDPSNSEGMRATVLAAIEVWERQERASGVEFGGRHWLTTPSALQDIRDVLQATLIPGDVWVDASREVVPMDRLTLQALWDAIVVRGGEIWQRRLQMEAEVTALSDAALATYSVGWASAPSVQEEGTPAA